MNKKDRKTSVDEYVQALGWLRSRQATHAALSLELFSD